MASARYYLGNIHFRGEAFTGSVDEARHASEQLSTFLSLFHSAEGSVGGQATDPDVKGFFDSLKVESHGERAVVTAVMPPGFLRKAVAESPKELETQPISGCSRHGSEPSIGDSVRCAYVLLLE